MSKEQIIPLVILLLPLLAAVAIMLFAKVSRTLSAGLSVGAVAIGLVLSIVLAFDTKDQVGGGDKTHPWLSIGTHPDNANTEIAPGVKKFVLDIEIANDPLSHLMLVVVTLIGSLVHVFSLVYMRKDKGFCRYFGALSFFVFSMLGIVLANNFVMMFIFWELVGVSSYLLISHWFTNPAAADAGKKAFITNRIGDAGFLIGILIIWTVLGSIQFDSISDLLADPEKIPVAWKAWGLAAGLLIFCGAVGKSAQFPLHVWLPDAMEGPTPVSALIHAATIVAAGVYMLCRVFFIFTDDALLVIAWIGGITSLIAALMAIQQNDIKRILAYSTLSQLGYMVMAVGCSGPGAAMFHLTTHAAFKALLFLAAGAVIYACHHEQDIWKMGGLRHRLPWTFRSFATGALALAGFPLLSGFFSKDAILMQAYYAGQMPLFILGVSVAVLTAFYMTRCVLVTFFGNERHEHAKEAKEVPSGMLVPLFVLAAFSVFVGLPQLGLGDHIHTTLVNLHSASSADGLETYNLIPSLETLQEDPAYASSHTAAMIWGTVAAALGMVLGWVVYRNASSDPLPAKLGPLATWMRDRFYFDEIYAFLNHWTQELLSKVADWFDRWIIAGLGVKGTSGAVDITGCLVRLFQSGNLQTYALCFAIGLLLILAMIIF